MVTIFGQQELVSVYGIVLECKKRKVRSHVKRKNGNIKHKSCTEKRINTSLKDISIVLDNHGRYGILSVLSSLLISVLRNYVI